MKYLLALILICSGCSSVIKPLPNGGGSGGGYNLGGGSVIRKNIFLNRTVVETPNSYGFLPK